MASFRIMTFGCKVNQCDSQVIRETLTSWGLTEASPADVEFASSKPERYGDETHRARKDTRRNADLIVINTCTVTGSADSKFRKALRRARRECPDSLLSLTGCYANKISGASERPAEADLVFRTRDFQRLAEFLRRHGMIGVASIPQNPGQSYFAEHTRAFLKIQDGCDCFCTYCIVPLVRPKLWSEKPENVIESINRLSSKGYREVVLTGIHLGFMGRDSANGGLVQLLGRIERECRIERVRLSSIEINEVTDDLLDLVTASKKICRHLHLPLQSGDDAVLRRMGRRYSSDFFLKRVEQIKDKLPDAGITTDLIVGFPGETDEQFGRTCEVVEKIGPAKIHVFRYSRRAGTKAAEINSPVPAAVAAARSRRLLHIGEDSARAFKSRFVGKTAYVLTESFADNGSCCVGLTSNYIRVKLPNPPDGCINMILPARLTGLDAADGLAIGEVI